MLSLVWLLLDWLLLVIVMCCQVEKKEFCRRVIQARVAEGHFGDKDIPCFEDVEKFSVKDVPDFRSIDGLAGGFPCQARCGCACAGACTSWFNPGRDAPKQVRKAA